MSTNASSNAAFDSVNSATTANSSSLHSLVQRLLQNPKNSATVNALKLELQPLQQFIQEPLRPEESYYRNKLIVTDTLEVMVASWKQGEECLPHDHGTSNGYVLILQGNYIETGYRFTDSGLETYDKHVHYAAGDLIPVQQGDIHSMRCLDSNGLTLHIYNPPIHRMKVYDLKSRATFTVSDETGAWVPNDSREILEEQAWPVAKSPTAIAMQGHCDLIMYTTHYREGGREFERAAQTKARELSSVAARPVVCERVESKKDFLRIFAELKKNNFQVKNFHFFGHSGMYGIMFGSREWPEQFSPFEWKTMQLPIMQSSEFFFHACRSGRWFAPFIARTLKVKAHGYHNYTTVSSRADRFAWEKLHPLASKNSLYIIACPGKKSHGVLGSVKKYSQLCPADKMLAFEPSEETVDTTYDSVAEMYENTFQDIQVRSDELVWLESKLAQLLPQSVLDIGCGNGAFLNQLSPHFINGVGVDLSQGMIAQAQKCRRSNSKLSFQKINGPHLPFADNSFDVVMSTLAFRYLDWDPCMKEILRVLKPGGRFLVLDMVAAPVKITETPKFVQSKTRQVMQNLTQQQFSAPLKKMVQSAAWKKMLAYNPIRSEHEMKWYLESRFPGNKVELLNVGWNSRIIAFDTGPVHSKHVESLSYP